MSSARDRPQTPEDVLPRATDSDVPDQLLVSLTTSLAASVSSQSVRQGRRGPAGLLLAVPETGAPKHMRGSLSQRFKSKQSLSDWGPGTRHGARRLGSLSPSESTFFKKEIVQRNGC